MSAFACCFCNHANPSDAQFCNACGSPLNLKPCAQCESVNNRDAALCHQCGAAFAVVGETVLASGDNEAALPDVHVADVRERLRTPELFAQSLETLAALERELLRSPGSKSEVIVPLPMAAERPIVSVPRERRARWQAVALALILVAAVESLAYFAQSRHSELDDWLGGVQHSVMAFAHADNPGRQVPPGAAESETRATANIPSNASGAEPKDETSSNTLGPANESPAEPKSETPSTAIGPSNESPAEPKSETPSNALGRSNESPAEPAAAVSAPAAAVPLVPSEATIPTAPPPQAAASDPPAVKSDRPAQRPRSGAAKPKRRSTASRAPEPPSRRDASPPPAAPASAPVERACTQAVAALGLCAPEGR